jgi:hypothetical protein
MLSPAATAGSDAFNLNVGFFKSNPKNAKSNPNHNPKSTLTTSRALTHNTCYAHTIKKESRVLDSQRSGLENVGDHGLLPRLA